MNLRNKILFGGACLVLCWLPAIASEPSAETTDTAIAEQMFQQAMNKRESGEIYTAIKMFEQITSLQPELNRARLELAVAYHQANRYQDAIRELRRVLDDENTPDNVRLSILAYLGQVSNDQRQPETTHHLSYYLKAGLLNNSNLNASQAVVTGLNTTSTAEISSLGTDITANVSHRFKRRDLVNIADTPTQFEWQSQATINSNFYSEDSAFNLNIISLATGPAFLSPGRWRSSLSMQADYIVLGQDPLATFIAFTPDITFDFGNFRSLLLEASYTTRDYDDAANNGYDGSATMLGVGFTTFLPAKNMGIEAGIRLVNEDADEPGFSHDRQEIYAGGFIALDDQMNSYIKFVNRGYEYDAPDPIVLVIRDETENNFAIGLNYDFLEGVFKDWTLNVEFSAIDSDSNVNSLDFDRNLISANWSRYFN